MLTKLVQVSTSTQSFYTYYAVAGNSDSAPFSLAQGTRMSKFTIARARRFVFSLYMSGIMSLMMSGIITLINTGLTAGFFTRWGGAFAVAWAVAFPLVIFIAPFAGKMADATIERFSGHDSSD
ncbi:DUF2798 domain-containing protein [Marinobacter sp. SS5-14b]|uniref:DUF2798 domain-containing protein n=1 Tax=Marinobacter sp. SS5-14b TaxID=3050456 RepID=UPI0026DFD547|nr:DUF2798 domain-containing protein [Marinobacter sp. SS5-14b]